MGNNVSVAVAASLARKLNANLALPIQAGAMAIAAEIQSVMQPYPPQRQGARYRRTGQYGQRWNIRRIPLGAVLENRRPAATYIGGPKQAAANRRAGWVGDEAAKVKVIGSGRAAAILRKVLQEAL